MSPSQVLLQAVSTYDTTPIRSSSPSKVQSIIREDADIVARSNSVNSDTLLSSSFSKPTRNITTPVWLHPNLTKAAAEAVLGPSPDGTFLVRRRVNPDEYVLSLMFMGAATHHLIAKNYDGVLEVNKKAYGDNRAIHTLVDALRLPRGDWPQPLLDFVPSSEASQGDIERELQFVANLKKGLQ